jgi:FixJ family two-component response regulator
MSADAIVHVIDDEDDVRQAIALLLRTVGLRPRPTPAHRTSSRATVQATRAASSSTCDCPA